MDLVFRPEHNGTDLNGILRMLFSKDKKRARVPGGFFHLEEEKTRTRASGYGHGDYIKLQDEYGIEWRGSAERNEDNSVTYRFRTSRGANLTGVSTDAMVVLRDGNGNTWKGFIG